MDHASTGTTTTSSPRQKAHRPRRPRPRYLIFFLIVAVIAVSVPLFLEPRMSHLLVHSESASAIAKADVKAAAAISPLRGRIVQLAEGQVGYTTDPSNTYCNKFSAYWVSGPADCGNSNHNEEWCADFAAWVWQNAGAEVVYQYINGDLNSSSASFYEWGVAHGTWHPVGSGYVPEPGDVAVYGLDTSTLVAQHVAIVVSDTSGDRGPDVVNGDGDRSAFSVVQVGNDEYKADAPGITAYLSGYVSPSSPTS